MDKVTSKQGWDLVFKLYRGGMSLVIDKIFNYLEVDCLDAELVLSEKLKPIFASCNFWKKQLMKKVHLSKGWKDMYDIVEATKPDLIHEEDGYQTVYYLISGKLMNLESYWNLGMAIPKKISFFSPIHHADLTPNLPQPPYDFYPTPSRSFGFNKTLDVIAEELEGSKLIIRNRFNLKLVKVLDLPALRPSPRPIINAHPEIYSVQLNEQFIVASFYQDAEVCIWDAATKNLLGILDGDLIVPGQEGSLASSKRSPFICLYGNLLLTIHEAESDVTYTMYKISDADPNEVASIVYRKISVVHQHVLKDVFMDDAIIVLAFHESHSKRFLIESRSVSSFALMRDIELESEHYAPCFHFLEGIICVGIEGRKILFWDAASESNPNGFVINYPLTIYNVKLVKNRFLVISGIDTSDSEGRGTTGFSIYDVKAFLNSSEDEYYRQRVKGRLVVFNDSSYDSGLSILADEFQIALVTKSPEPFEDESILSLWDITGDWGPLPISPI